MELIDLTKILKVGDAVYCSILGTVITIRIFCEGNSPIIADGFNLTKYGQWYSNHPLSECVIFPSKTQRDWKEYVRDLEYKKKKSELLDKAIKDYPIGTKINMITLVGKAEVAGIPEFAYSDDNSIEVKCIGGVSRYLYHNGKWAKIIKVPLFTTEDGVEVFGEETIWFLHIKNNVILGPSKAKELSPSINQDFRYFSSKSAAEDYIAKNNKKSLFTPEQKAEIIELIKSHGKL